MSEADTVMCAHCVKRMEIPALRPGKTYRKECPHCGKDNFVTPVPMSKPIVTREIAELE